DKTSKRAFLNAYPTRLSGVLIDRIPIDRLTVRFAGSDSVVATLDADVTPTHWSVPFPDSTSPLHKEGSLVVRYRATNVYGCGTSDTLNLLIDLTAPSRLILDHSLPTAVNRSLFVISGTAPGADSLIFYYTPPGGTEHRIAKGPTSAGGQAFRDSLFL